MSFKHSPSQSLNTSEMKEPNLPKIQELSASRLVFTPSNITKYVPNRGNSEKYSGNSVNVGKGWLGVMQGVDSIVKPNSRFLLNAGNMIVLNDENNDIRMSLSRKFREHEGLHYLPFLHLTAPAVHHSLVHDLTRHIEQVKQKLNRLRFCQIVHRGIRDFLHKAGLKVECGARRVAIGVKQRLDMIQTLGSLEPDVNLSSREPCTGDTLSILVTVPPPRGFVDMLQLAFVKQFGNYPMVEIHYRGQKVPVYHLLSNPTKWRALVASTPLDKEGASNILVQVRDGRHRLYVKQVLLKEREYPVESIWLPEPKVGLKGTEMELDAVKAFRSRQSEEQRWKLPLTVPCNGEITTEYGLKRFYNGVFAEGYFHRGVDYGADVGEPVVSPAGGRVTLVGREREGFALHGNCVGVDHGQGVMSLMLHLNSIHVSEGEMVKAGEQIGTVGSTGMATGPHLHWGLYVNGECIDPKVWMSPQAWD